MIYFECRISSNSAKETTKVKIEEQFSDDNPSRDQGF